MKIVIIGPGALGCLIAAAISSKLLSEKNAPELWLLDHRPDRVLQIRENGLLLEEDGRRLSLPARISCDPAEIGPADLIILCVKFKDTESALARANLLATADTLLLTLQNGIGHLPLLASSQIVAEVAIGVSAQGATLLAPGQVRHAGRGPTLLGFDLNAADPTFSSRLADAARLLSAAGIETRVVDNILDHVWAKLFVNVGINALTAIIGCPNGRLLELPDAKSRMAAAVKEAAAVARALGIKIDKDPVAATREVCLATRDNFSSMLQDVRNKRRTEIDSINGAVATEARRLRIPAPVNEGLIRAVKELEQAYLS